MPYDLVKVDLRAKKLENGDDFLKVNPKGQVPALALDTGELITEGPVDRADDRRPGCGQKPRPRRDSAERYKLLEWLNFITTELHKNFSPMFSPVLADDAKAFFKDRSMGKFKYVDSQLAGRDYLMGKQFTVADGYLFTMLSWADRLKFDLSALPNLLSLQGPRRRAPEGAGGADQGRPDEGRVREGVIPGRCAASNPEFREIPGLVLAHHPGMTADRQLRRLASRTDGGVTPPPASSAGSGRRMSRPSPPCRSTALAA